ncbi:MAG: hypothetical protein DHS20C09_07070 [marine bacterium B5-7]|nr:MAG: hypothetical protein DHS20C09_07070 [marine bacterium B5-7]
MDDLGDISIERLYIELERLKEKVRGDSKAMHNLHASKGLIRSGQTIAAEVENGKSAFFAFRDTCIQQLQVMSDEAVILTEASVTKVKTSISNMFTELYSVTFETMTKSCELSTKPELLETFMPQIENEMNNTLIEVNLFISERVIAKRNKSIKNIFKTIFGGIKKLLMPGAG